MKALLIDHDDSFTHNLKHWLNPGFSEVCVVNHLENFTSSVKQFDLIALSPGPKSPADYPHSLEFLSALPPDKPVLGICLGMQIMVHCEGGLVATYSPPLHGKTSELKVTDASMEALANIKVARYHSLCCQPDPSKFKVLARSHPDEVAMCIQHHSKKWLGFQFHPESFLTEKPTLILDLLLRWTNS